MAAAKAKGRTPARPRPPARRGGGARRAQRRRAVTLVVVLALFLAIAAGVTAASLASGH